MPASTASSPSLVRPILVTCIITLFSSPLTYFEIFLCGKNFLIFFLFLVYVTGQELGRQGRTGSMPLIWLEPTRLLIS